MKQRGVEDIIKSVREVSYLPTACAQTKQKLLFESDGRREL